MAANHRCSQSQPLTYSSHTVKSKSESNLYYDRWSLGQSVLMSSTHLGAQTRCLLLSDSCGFVYVERPLWRVDGSVVYFIAAHIKSSMSSLGVAWKRLPTMYIPQLHYSCPHRLATSWLQLMWFFMFFNQGVILNSEYIPWRFVFKETYLLYHPLEVYTKIQNNTNE
jgi:hypothetical protein